MVGNLFIQSRLNNSVTVLGNQNYGFFDWSIKINSLQNACEHVCIVGKSHWTNIRVPQSFVNFNTTYL